MRDGCEERHTNSVYMPNTATDRVCFHPSIEFNLYEQSRSNKNCTIFNGATLPVV